MIFGKVLADYVYYLSIGAVTASNEEPLVGSFGFLYGRDMCQCHISNIHKDRILVLHYLRQITYPKIVDS